MPSAEKKQKAQKPVRDKTKKQRARQSRRSERTSNLALECFLRGEGRCQDYFMAKVIGKMGGGRFTIQDDEGNIYRSIPILGSLKLKGRAVHNATMATAIGTDDYVLTDAKLKKIIVAGREETISQGTIYGVLNLKEVAQVRRKLAENIGLPSPFGKARSRSGNTNSLFNYSSNRSAKSLGKKLAARKASHKQTKKANRAGSAAGSVVASVASSAGSAVSDVLLVAGKKVYDAAGEKLHGEELRQAKRELAGAAAGAK
jgi:hypothetical protein